MGAMDAERLELYELLKPKLDEEPARALVLALPPRAESLATKDDLIAAKSELKGDVSSLKSELKGDLLSVKSELVAIEARMDARFARLEATLTRRMVTILGGWTVIFGSTVGWVAAFLR